MPSLRLALGVWSVAGPVLIGGVVYASMLAREAIVTAGAVKTARDEAAVACNARVGEIERRHNAAVDERIADAVAAARALPPTPDAAADLQALCDRSASCMSRRRP